MFTLNGVVIDTSTFVHTGPAAIETWTGPPARELWTGPAAREVWTAPAGREVWTGPPGQVVVGGSGHTIASPATQPFVTTGAGILLVDRATNPDFIERAGGAIVYRRV
ncbi:hypothetical protein [Megalodesulfovibrio paquesii]